MLSDEAYVIENLFMIADKEGNDIPFILNPVQRLLDEKLSRRDLVPKARQVGASSYVLGRFTAACLAKRNTRAVVISHDQESTQRMLKRVQYFLDNIRGPRPLIRNMSANEITFPKTNSMFYIGTAGSRKFGRGDTITNLHCSEYAYWPNPPELMRGLLQAVPKSGEIMIESTGNGLNDYYSRCMRAYTGNSAWKLHFFPWHEFPEYTLDLTPEEQELFIDSMDPLLEEDELLDWGLTVGQLAWRRDKLEEMNYDLKSFKQEYPKTLDECFQTSGESIFHVIRYVPSAEWKQVDTGFWILEGHPQEGYTYVMGSDVAAGVGRDSSVAEVFCINTCEQVGEYTNSRIDPDSFGVKLKAIGDIFGYPYLNVESNNHGLLTLSTLDKMYPPAMLHTEEGPRGKGEDRELMGLGSRTTARSKPLMVGALRRLLADTFIIHSPLLNTELSTFIEHPDGKLGAQKGCYDDAVMAAACAAKVWELAGSLGPHSVLSATSYHSTGVDPFSYEEIFKQLQRGGQGYPIRPQTSKILH